MFGTRQDPAPFRGRSILALSVLVLLASGCLPVLAQAESSAGLQYQDAPPTVPGHTAANDKDPTAHSANTGGGSGNDSGSTGGGSDKGGSSGKSGGTADAAGGGEKQGSQAKDDGKGSGNPSQAPAQRSTSPVSEDDGGSSPLVPILIAIAVLAAISIGVVVMRQRRRSDPSSGSPVSPEAG